MKSKKLKENEHTLEKTRENGIYLQKMAFLVLTHLLLVCIILIIEFN